MYGTKLDEKLKMTYQTGNNLKMGPIYSLDFDFEYFLVHTNKNVEETILY